MAGAVADIDHGYAKAIEAFGEGATVRCGIQGSDAVREHDDKSRLSVVEIATVHEFGSSDGRIPQRSFLRSTFDESQAELSKLLSRLGSQVAALKMSTEQAVELIGLRYVDLVKAKIRNHIAPLLAESTIVKKGSSTPLIDTGRLIGSLRAVVRVGDKANARPGD